MDRNPLISLELLEELIGPFLPVVYSNKLSLNSRGRYRTLVEVRIIYTSLAHNMGHPVQDIAKVLKKDRTVMLYYIKQFRNLMQTDPDFRDKFYEIKNRIQTYYPYEPSIVDYTDQVQYQPEPGIFLGLLSV